MNKMGYDILIENFNTVLKNYVAGANTTKLEISANRGFKFYINDVEFRASYTICGHDLLITTYQKGNKEAVHIYSLMFDEVQNSFVCLSEMFDFETKYFETISKSKVKS